MSRSSRAWASFLLSRAIGAAVDAVVLGGCYLAAFSIRFDFQEPPFGWQAVVRSFATVCAVHLAALVGTGCYSLTWRRIRLADLPRYVLAMAIALAAMTVFRFTLADIAYLNVRPPFSISVILCLLATVSLVGVRVMWRIWCESRRGPGFVLEREARHFDNVAAAQFLCGKCVMVTGAGGTIGSEIVRQAAAAGARRVLMVERGENALYHIDRMMRERAPGVAVPFLLDAGDGGRMRGLLAAERPEIVLHAAAYKHVPMVEANPEEGWRNNCGATETLAAECERAGVARFVLISTDKAVNPVSVMGKTKLAAERAILSGERARGNGTTSFCAVRFGNVYGSSGSVAELFREQIAAGGPVTVTHPDMRRYFMTVEEAVSLVLQAASRTERAIYTLDMGAPVRIVELAERMIAEAGFRPYVEIPIAFTGVRPGEKLFEEIDVSEERCFKTDMAKIYITKGE